MLSSWNKVIIIIVKNNILLVRKKGTVTRSQNPQVNPEIPRDKGWKGQTLVKINTIWANSWDYSTLRKLNLQTRIRSKPLGLHVWILVRHFVYFHTLGVRIAKALARRRGCTVSPEPSLVACAISTIISWAGSFDHLQVNNFKTVKLL